VRVSLDTRSSAGVRTPVFGPAQCMDSGEQPSALRSGSWQHCFEPIRQGDGLRPAQYRLSGQTCRCRVGPTGLYSIIHDGRGSGKLAARKPPRYSNRVRNLRPVQL